MNYRSSDPRTIEAWENHQADHVRFSAAVRALVPPADSESPTYKPEAYVQTSRWSPGARELVGFSWRWGAPIPDGWKFERKDHLISPKVSTTAGKKVRATFPLPVAGLHLPGMPTSVLRGLSLVTPGIERVGDEMVVSWGDNPPPADQIDADIWTARNRHSNGGVLLKRRPDGWPLCPICGEDELWSPFNWDGTGIKPEISEYESAGLTCYRCHWQSARN